MPLETNHQVDCRGANSCAILTLPSMAKDDIRSCISSLLEKEGYYMCHDYLEGNKKDGARCRAKVCQWIFHIVDCAKLQRETAIVAISYLDRHLSSSKRARCDRKEYQLAAMTSVYIAIKWEADCPNVNQEFECGILLELTLFALLSNCSIKITAPFEMDASTLSGLSRGLQSAENIISYESIMLSSLRWKLHGPTPPQFINYILALLPQKSIVAVKISCESCRQIEFAYEDYACVPLRRSTLAVSSILNSLTAVAQDDFPLDKRAQFVREICDVFDLDANSPLIKAVRRRLLPRVSSICEIPEGVIPKQVEKCTGTAEEPTVCEPGASQGLSGQKGKCCATR
ncbi:LOW QUALITY PROTEIN: hypothetical protein ACHAXR_006789 [Thalassiosira sp. AJA248-18]